MNKRTLFVSNLSQDTGHRQIKAAFESFGEIKSIQMPSSTTEKYTGCAFLVFSSVFSADKAMIMNGQKIAHNEISVQKARDRQLAFYHDFHLEA